MQKDKTADALQIFQKFAHFDDAEVHYKAFGLAGECVVYSIMPGREKDSAEKIDELQRLLRRPNDPPGTWRNPNRLEIALGDPYLVRALGYAMRKETKSVDKQNATEWEKWTDSHFHDEAAPQGN